MLQFLFFFLLTFMSTFPKNILNKISLICSIKNVIKNLVHKTLPQTSPASHQKRQTVICTPMQHASLWRTRKDRMDKQTTISSHKICIWSRKNPQRQIRIASQRTHDLKSRLNFNGLILFMALTFTDTAIDSSEDSSSTVNVCHYQQRIGRTCCSS